jgi:hypothetical protein
MSYIKSLLPDDWEPKYQSPKKYLCIGTEEVEAQWLPRWYGVPFDECCFPEKIPSKHIRDDVIEYTPLIKLTYRSDGDYEEHLKILKTERLLNGK